MTVKLTRAIFISCSLCIPGTARAQASGNADTPTLNALLGEVRLLRQAIERQSALAGRAQLLVGKLALQDQRVARWQAEARDYLGRVAERLPNPRSVRTRVVTAPPAVAILD